MNLYPAQRTNFQTTMPRLATQPGMQRQVFQRSANRGKKSPAPDTMLDAQQMLKKFAMFNPNGAA